MLLIFFIVSMLIVRTRSVLPSFSCVRSSNGATRRNECCNISSVNIKLVKKMQHGSK